MSLALVAGAGPPPDGGYGAPSLNQTGEKILDSSVLKMCFMKFFLLLDLGYLFFGGVFLQELIST